MDPFRIYRIFDSFQNQSVQKVFGFIEKKSKNISPKAE